MESVCACVLVWRGEGERRREEERGRERRREEEGGERRKEEVESRRGRWKVKR